MAKDQVSVSLRPLDAGIEKAAHQIENCARNLAGISWNARIIFIAVLVGFATVALGGIFVRFLLFGEKIDEAKRYEMFGRKVETVIGNYKPKDQEKIYRWIGGRP